jgi:GNAT superfamily N-acetyltransferase
MVVTVERVEVDDPRVTALVVELTEFLAALDKEQAPFFQSHSKLSTLDAMFLALVDGEPVGCGGFRVFEDGSGEVKRMYVRPECRGLGVGRKILAVIEQFGKEAGVPRLILETHRDLAPALALYQGYGFARIPQYGPYVGVEISVCLGKSFE